MRLSGDWLTHPGTVAVMQALEGAGGRALFVGGCVRDAVLDRRVGDIDIATDLTPERVVEAVRAAGLKAVPTGIDHGTVTVIAAHKPHEVTTFRRDVETFGRHAVVAFSTEVADDAARRDFTMNALYADAAGAVIDPLGSGLRDALARHVRFIGDPEDRIREDYLRILRFFRFSAVVGDPELGLDAEGLAACAALAEGLGQLSRERIGAEMRKLLAASDPAPALAAMAQAGVLARVLPGAETGALAPLVHLEGGHRQDWLRRLAVLGGEDAEGRLRLSRAEARDLDALRRAIGSTESAAVLGWCLGAERGADAVLARAAVMGTPVGLDALDEVARGAAARFPITAADLAPLTGKDLGARLKALEARWLAGGLCAGKDELLR
ncbi:CCA tRNA nucleotidyltransferase [Neotabrizicola shimadae]|uniref:CCA tRNA nucleotidyltransferase n=1 Tax=Neotabrizicola shimadae TaxID=2807096 RepID=A0A8G1EB96_9RHOB|nr:CCA tRNA nucleotidyltransferase [Neotabrizicola shimadae]QYZ69162.1 CCA tRNA nucleotidyltransferase [Neotabrizicola shimadae]